MKFIKSKQMIFIIIATTVFFNFISFKTFSGDILNRQREMLRAVVFVNALPKNLANEKIELYSNNNAETRENVTYHMTPYDAKVCKESSIKGIYQVNPITVAKQFHEIISLNQNYLLPIDLQNSPMNFSLECNAVGEIFVVNGSVELKRKYISENLIYIILESKNARYVFNTFRSQTKNNGGFSAYILKNSICYPDKYNISLLITDKGTQYIGRTDKTIDTRILNHRINQTVEQKP
jgi:hypothetical protein